MSEYGLTLAGCATLGFIIGWLLRDAVSMLVGQKQAGSPVLFRRRSENPAQKESDSVERPWGSHPRWGHLSRDSFVFDSGNGLVHVTDDYTQDSDITTIDQFADECGLTAKELLTRIR